MAFPAWLLVCSFAAIIQFPPSGSIRGGHVDINSRDPKFVHTMLQKWNTRPDTRKINIELTALKELIRFKVKNSIDKLRKFLEFTVKDNNWPEKEDQLRERLEGHAIDMLVMLHDDRCKAVPLWARLKRLGAAHGTPEDFMMDLFNSFGKEGVTSVLSSYVKEKRANWNVDTLRQGFYEALQMGLQSSLSDPHDCSNVGVVKA